MSDQPYEGPGPYEGTGSYEGTGPYEGYDPYQQPQQPQQPPPSEWPGHQGHQQQYGAGAGSGAGAGPEADADADEQQYTQQWEGQTWETQFQPTIPPAAQSAAPPADPAYLPPQQAPQGQGQSQGQGQVQDQYAAQYDSRGSQGGQYGVQNGQGSHGGQGGQYGVVGQPMPAETGWSQAGHPQGAYGSHQTPASAPTPTPTPAPTPVPGEPTSATGDASAPGYGPPTVTGNSRLTAAQRARAEGRSPIIEPGVQPAALTAVLGLLLAGAAVVGEYALVVPLVILQAVTAAGWFRLNGMWPARQGIALAFAGALTADVAVLADGRDNAPAAILGTLGVWVLLTLVLQLRSHASPDERMQGLMATVASAALAIVATGHLAAEPDAVTVGGLAVAATILARALPLPTVVSVAVALAAGAGVGGVAGAVTDLGTASGALLGAGAGVCALIGHRVASYDYPSRFVHFTAGVALPLAAAAPAVYVLGRALS
ncbi:hypothetical protein [Streptomyces sp. NBC_00878]|uniref:hypothetical protein n=1 Tax=Streptomyces sp. NBC_00878 TaxID=2975854 RepID=UPI002252E4FB|nr:hypothetical protein [Streptomyces sp. NBC_00878]MCX4906732.1 hypothetical protein [Streptomyces sp. NBC_00878]